MKSMVRLLTTAALRQKVGEPAVSAAQHQGDHDGKKHGRDRDLNPAVVHADLLSVRNAASRSEYPVKRSRASMA